MGLFTEKYPLKAGVDNSVMLGLVSMMYRSFTRYQLVLLEY
ncbi:hypothetical protein NI35_3715 [Salmonella enterica subsp. enterica serovar Cerro]|nr:hypothetical protein GW13_PRO3453 [Salmonella enterica subsp. enterica serovar Cerro]KMN28480.1 hypothetical protein NI35_3715 [Salmonella enterica subsp. enterica serovar Cerro]